MTIIYEYISYLRVRIGYFLSLVRDRIRCTRRIDTEILIYLLYKSGAVDTGCQRIAAPYILAAEELLGIVEKRLSGSCRSIANRTSLLISLLRRCLCL